MSRAFSEVAFLYLVPFAVYLLVLVIRRLAILSLDRWTRRVVTRLSVAGLALVLGGLLLNGFFADRHEGAYAPAHIENGRLVPGAIQ